MARSTVDVPDDVQIWMGDGRYKEGFFTQLETDELAHGINEDVVRAISAKRNEPEWMLEFRLNAFKAWLEMEEPHWLKAHYEKLDSGTIAIIPRLPAVTAMTAAALSPVPSSNPGLRT